MLFFQGPAKKEGKKERFTEPNAEFSFPEAQPWPQGKCQWPRSCSLAFFFSSDGGKRYSANYKQKGKAQ